MIIKLIFSIAVFLVALVALMWNILLLLLLPGRGWDRNRANLLFLNLILGGYTLIMACLFFVQYARNLPTQALGYYQFMLYGVYASIGVFLIVRVQEIVQNRQKEHTEVLLANINLTFKVGIVRLSALPLIN